MSLLRKPRFFWIYPLAAWLFATASISEPSLRLGVAIALLGEAVRLWANGYVGHVKVNWTDKAEPKKGTLITAGPYAYVRNPLYVGTFLVGLGFCVVVRNVWWVAGGIVLFVMLYRRKAIREAELIQGEWGDVYAAYQRAVPAWFPSLRRYPDRQGRWSWKGIAASKEPKTLIWVIVGLIALYFREELWQQQEPFAPDNVVKRVALAVVLVSLMATDGILELRRRAKRCAAT